MLPDKKLTKKDLVDRLVTIEFAECNDIFLYVVNSLRNESHEFKEVGAQIRDHLQHIERFLESLPGCQEYLALIRHIPSVWEGKILIVEDMDYISQFLEAVLASEGSVEMAGNGAEGLRKLSKTQFDVVVSDVDMPMVSGIEFYEQAAKKRPEDRREVPFFVRRPYRSAT